MSANVLEECTVSIFKEEVSLRNVGNHLSYYKASHPRRDTAMRTSNLTLWNHSTLSSYSVFTTINQLLAVSDDQRRTAELLWFSLASKKITLLQWGILYALQKTFAICIRLSANNSTQTGWPDSDEMQHVIFLRFVFILPQSILGFWTNF
jgi:hypothetical protein